MASGEHRELYRWKKQINHVQYKPLKPPTDDIHEWMKRVEEASDMAAAAAFGLDRASKRGSSVKLTSVMQLREHNETFEEAQDLVRDWVNSKMELDFDDNLENEIWSEDSREKKTQDDGISIDAIVQEATGYGLDGEYNIAKSAAHLIDLDSYDECALANGVLQAMRDKECVHPKYLADLGLDEGGSTGKLKRKNPVVKMELRHKQVKDNRDRWQREVEKKRKELQAKREILLLVKQQQMKEEKDRASQAKREETEIQQEMARIRKELIDERKKSREESKKRLEHVEAMHQQMKKEAENPVTQNPSTDRQRDKVAQKRLLQQKILVQQARNNLKTLQAHFGAWYNIVVDKRAQLGRALAIADWKRLLHAWNAWRTAARHVRMDREQLEHEAHLKELYRKQRAADEHYRTVITRKYFIAWQLWVIHQEEERNLEKMQHSFRSKMASFLHAASRTHVPESDGSERLNAIKGRSGDSTRAAPSVEEVATAKGQDHAMWTKQLTKEKAHHDAWPVTKRYQEFMAHKGPQRRVNRTSSGTVVEQTAVARFLDGDRGAAKDVAEEGGAVSLVVDEEAVPRTFASRYAAQQKALREQQRQLREQQRLIQELKFEQGKQSLEQQAGQSHLLGEQLQMLAARLTKSLALHRDITADDVLSNDKSGGGAVTMTPSLLTDRTNASSGVTSNSRTDTVASASSSNLRNAKFVNAMNERAAARAKAKAEREERRRKAEEEQLTQLKAEEDERRLKEEEEKKQHLAVFQERRRLEQQKKLDKQHQLERMQQLTSLAEEHCVNRLLKHYALEPWKRAMAATHARMQRAEAVHSATLLRTCLFDWHEAVQELASERDLAATRLYQRTILKKSFHNWRKWNMQSAIMDQKADRFYTHNQKQKFLKAWLDYATDEKIGSWERERLASEHSARRLAQTAFVLWKQLPLASKKDQERAKRRDDMRRKVASLLPDFEGSRLSASSESRNSDA